MSKRTRLKIAIAAFIINCLIFITAMIIGSDLTATGAGLSMLNVPVLTYIFGETKRSSSENESNT